MVRGGAHSRAGGAAQCLRDPYGRRGADRRARRALLPGGAAGRRPWPDGAAGSGPWPDGGAGRGHWPDGAAG
ncbi:hypothetical protein DLJ59_02365, partial [Micromonospora inaquosa]